MSLSLPLEDIIITIDTREQNKKRISAVETWGLAHGAIVEHSKLDLCDYRIMGDFRDYEINIGIEAKGLSDFCSCDYEDLKRKLFDSFELYDDVALFIETANYVFLNEGFGNSVIINSAVRDGSANICNLAQLEGCVHTLERNGVYVNQLRSEVHFPFAIENLLTYIIHDHDVIKYDPKMYLRSYKHTLKSFMTSAQVKKTITSYPNLFWLCSASEESYKEVFGSKAGTKLYSFIRNSELVTEEWKNRKFYDGTNKVQLPELEICDKIKEAIVDYLTKEYPHAYTVDELCNHFNIEQGDDDKEAFLIYIKELAWEKKITNTVSGEITITRALQSRCDPVGALLDKPPTITTPKIPTDDNDKTDKSVLTTIPPPPEPKTKGKAPVLSESKSKIMPDTEMDVLGSDKPLSYAEGEEKPLLNHRMSARTQLEGYLQSPHTLQECVNKFNMFTSGTIFEHIQRMKKEGVIVEFDNKTLIMTK